VSGIDIHRGQQHAFSGNRHFLGLSISRRH
jgi:hypothetical protein